MSHSLLDYLRRRPIEILDMILDYGNGDKEGESYNEAILLTLLVIKERGEAVPPEVRQHARGAWRLLKGRWPGIDKLYPELEER